MYSRVCPSCGPQTGVLDTQLQVGMAGAGFVPAGRRVLAVVMGFAPTARGAQVSERGSMALSPNDELVELRVGLTPSQAAACRGALERQLPRRQGQRQMAQTGPGSRRRHPPGQRTSPDHTGSSISRSKAGPEPGPCHSARRQDHLICAISCCTRAARPQPGPPEGSPLACIRPGYAPPPTLVGGPLLVSSRPRLGPRVQAEPAIACRHGP